MDEKAVEANYPWNTTPPEIWEKVRRTPPDTPHYQKLALLAQLKAAEAQNAVAAAMAWYTKWLSVFTILIALGTIAQAVFVALSYLSSRR